MKITPEKLELSYAWMGEVRQIPVHVQVSTLGINLDELKAQRVLDVGCGKDALLVRYLRAEGINAHGLDFRVEANDFLMKGVMPKGRLSAGLRIPREDNSYNLIVGHCMDDFYNTIPTDAEKKRMEAFEDKHNIELKRSDFALLEAFRVLSPGGRMIIYPGIRGIEKLKGNWRIEQQALDTTALGYSQIQYVDPQWFSKSGPHYADLQHRTIISKF